MFCLRFDLILVGAVVLLQGAFGCSATGNLLVPSGSMIGRTAVYGGVKSILKYYKSGHDFESKFLWYLGLIPQTVDLPLSMVADSVYLPYTISLERRGLKKYKNSRGGMEWNEDDLNWNSVGINYDESEDEIDAKMQLWPGRTGVINKFKYENVIYYSATYCNQVTEFFQFILSQTGGAVAVIRHLNYFDKSKIVSVDLKNKTFLMKGGFVDN